MIVAFECDGFNDKNTYTFLRIWKFRRKVLILQLEIRPEYHSGGILAGPIAQLVRATDS